MFTKKFDGNVWRWLCANVLGKLCPAATTEDAGKVVAVDSNGAYVLSGDYAQKAYVDDLIAQLKSDNNLT